MSVSRMENRNVIEVIELVICLVSLIQVELYIETLFSGIEKVVIWAPGNI